ncbi:hypothetical protein A8E01_33340, partial [Burkholderia cenocepacia]
PAPAEPGAALPDASEVSAAIDAIDTLVALDAMGVPQQATPAAVEAGVASTPDPVIPAARARGAVRSAMPLRKQEDA